MGRERKHVKYMVVVNCINGDKQEFNFDGINMKYREMLNRYSEVKEKFGNDKDVLNIQFIGITKDKEINVIYTKEVSKENNKLDFVNEENPAIAILNNLKFMRNNSKSYCDINDFYDDIQIPLLHEFENFEYNDLSAVELTNKIIKIRKDRRINKNKKIAIDELNNSIYKLDNLITKFEYINNLWTGNVTCSEKAIKKYSRMHDYHEVKYNSENERLFLLEKLKQEGWNTVIDLRNGYIGYCGSTFNINSKPNEDKIECNSKEDNIKTIKFSQKIPKEKGSSIIITYCSMKEKMKIINDLHDKYEKCENLEESGAIKLINRIA